MEKRHDGTMLFVDAPVEVRFERLKKRGRLGDEETLESFKKGEELELRGQTSSVGQNILGVKKLANHILTNDADLQSFYKNIRRTLGL